MRYFYERLQKRCATLKHTVQGTFPECVVEALTSENVESVCAFDAPYVQCVRQYLQENAEAGSHKLLLVADSRNAAIKTAVLLSTLQDWDEQDEAEWCSYEDEDDDLTPHTLLHLDFSTFTCADKKETAYRMTVAFLNEAESDNVLFTGLDSETDLCAKLQAVACSKVRNQFVYIEPRQLTLPTVQQLIYECGYSVLMVPELSREYYTDLFDKLLSGATYQLSKDVRRADLVQMLRKKRGERFCEEDLAVLLDLAVKDARGNENPKVLLGNNFRKLVSVKDARTYDTLMSMRGLTEVKDVAEELVALLREQQKNGKLTSSHNHMVFYGKPGTGKTTCGELLAELLAEEGFGNGNFVVATRKDLLGEFVGHTAPRVAKKFEEAKGGILFVDEAGFFLQRESGGFVDEAVKEFVRYMEKETDVIVIFAMYPAEAQAFMNMDAGLLSRIKRFVHFADYSMEDLLAIADSMFEKNGYKVGKSCHAVIEEYIRDAMRREKDKFGNARAVRNLVEMSITQISLRHFRESDKPVKMVVTAEDIRRAAAKLGGMAKQGANSFGFLSGGATKKNEVRA